jgi:hypothetical protein
MQVILNAMNMVFHTLFQNMMADSSSIKRRVSTWIWLRTSNKAMELYNKLERVWKESVLVYFIVSFHKL